MGMMRSGGGVFVEYGGFGDWNVGNVGTREP